MFISVLIPTFQRSKKIIPCVKSLLENNHQQFEIIIVDQNKDMNTKNVLKKINSRKIKYYHLFHSKGKAKALNFAISKTKGDILAFTDDDCLVEKNWLSEMNKSFKKYPKVIGVLGTVFPYRSEKNTGKICPAINPKRKELMLSENNYKFEHLGLGNNMAFKKSLFKKSGFFKPWLGIGSVSKAGFESEFIYRVIRQSKLIYITQKARVYHNRWQTPKEHQEKQNMYTCGYLAFCSYYLFKGDFQIIKLILAKLKRRILWRIKEFSQTGEINILAGVLKESFYFGKGFFLGFYFRFFEDDSF